MCFDKTGTLTEDGLDIVEIRYATIDKGIIVNYFIHYIDSEQLSLNGIIKNIGNRNQINEESGQNDNLSCAEHESESPAGEIKDESESFPRAQIFESLATCHHITVINSEYIGDPLDVKAFEATKCVLDEQEIQNGEIVIRTTVKPPDTEMRIGIVRRFEFLSKLQRMSVIVKTLDESEFRMHIKGSPEKVRELCRPESIPSDFHEVLSKYTQVKFYSYLLIIIGRIQSSCLRYKNP